MVQALLEFCRRAFQASQTTGSTDTKMMPSTITSKRFFTNGSCPRNQPAGRINPTQATAPTTLKNMNRERFIAPMPATKGANVRMIGTKRAMMIVAPPCLR